MAIRAAATVEGTRVRDALEQLGPYDGPLKRYDPLLTRESHDALSAEDYPMPVWTDGYLVPAAPTRIPPRR